MAPPVAQFSFYGTKLNHRTPNPSRRDHPEPEVCPNELPIADSNPLLTFTAVSQASTRAARTHNIHGCFTEFHGCFTSKHKGRTNP